MPFSVFLSILEASSYLLPFGKTTVHLDNDSNTLETKRFSDLLWPNLKKKKALMFETFLEAIQLLKSLAYKNSYTLYGKYRRK